MVNIDYIMDLLDWNNSEEQQAKGIALAREVKSINVFLQPTDKYHNKNVWENCAAILAERSDEELSYYLIELLKWLQDMNWPGAFCISDRMKQYRDESSLQSAFFYCTKQAKLSNDETWERNLCEIKPDFMKPYSLYQFLGGESQLINDGLAMKEDTAVFTHDKTLYFIKKTEASDDVLVQYDLNTECMTELFTLHDDKFVNKIIDGFLYYTDTEGKLRKAQVP